MQVRAGVGMGLAADSLQVASHAPKLVAEGALDDFCHADRNNRNYNT